MDNYFKGKNVEQEFERDKIPINNLPQNFLWMQVKGGSKMTNLLSHASGIFEDKSSTAMVWSGAGAAIPKAISCAEIIKRQFPIKNQVTKLSYKKVEEYWEPKVDNLETLVVERQIPVIHILLSMDPIPDIRQSGYQDDQEKKFWQSPTNPGKANSRNPKYKKPTKYKNVPKEK